MNLEQEQEQGFIWALFLCVLYKKFMRYLVKIAKM